MTAALSKIHLTILAVLQLFMLSIVFGVNQSFMWCNQRNVRLLVNSTSNWVPEDCTETVFVTFGIVTFAVTLACYTLFVLCALKAQQVEEPVNEIE